MHTTIIGIKDFRQNISLLAKNAKKNNITYLITIRNKPILEVKPSYELEIDEDIQLNYYKTLEYNLNFWDSKKDDNIFKT